MEDGSLCIISFNAASAGCGNTGALSGGASSKSPDEFSVIMLEALRKKLGGSASAREKPGFRSEKRSFNYIRMAPEMA